MRTVLRPRATDLGEAVLRLLGRLYFLVDEKSGQHCVFRANSATDSNRIRPPSRVAYARRDNYGYPAPFFVQKRGAYANGTTLRRSRIESTPCRKLSRTEAQVINPRLPGRVPRGCDRWLMFS